MKKIDAHSHIGDFGGWAKVSMDIETLIKDMNEYEVEKTVLCSSGPKTNNEVLDAYNKYSDRIIPLVYINPNDGEKAINEAYYYLKEKNFKGIKMNPLSNSFVADDLIVDPILDIAEELKVPVFIHSGHPPYSLPWSIGLLAERHSNVDIVMIHMGHGHGVYIDAALKMARRYKNIYLEHSGMPMNSKIYEAYKTVGSDRIMFGIDAPFHHPTIEIQKVLTSGLNEKEMEDVFYNNAYKLFNKQKNCLV